MLTQTLLPNPLRYLRKTCLGPKVYIVASAEGRVDEVHTLCRWVAAQRTRTSGPDPCDPLALHFAWFPTGTSAFLLLYAQPLAAPTFSSYSE
jgi:hypothetical protein